MWIYRLRELFLERVGVKTTNVRRSKKCSSYDVCTSIGKLKQGIKIGTENVWFVDAIWKNINGFYIERTCYNGVGWLIKVNFRCA
jgi:hypothetical protein